MNEENNGNGKLAKKRFQNKAALAWVSMISMIIFTVALWFFVPETRLKIIAEASAWIYFAFTSVIGASLGLKTWSEKK
jgi:uncharacterized membrane protein (GlpM family)